MLVMSTDHFYWDKVNGRFTAKIRVLQSTEFGYHQVTKIDELSYGFNMKSTHTGKELLFIWQGATRDDDNDIMYWTYEAFDWETNKKFTLRVYNE